ncbi:flavin reductase family protein [Emcibacter nanhaiensis]|uniref:Flavin reductase family protein n=1 Tax=Emcibacter nanhaiensis TaxID=1505037 RepID=A0A501PUS0_9PROT|nr:flavin reductase family protein [Emcibacter nanhaiensis]TPD63812.1 flavin reductase family protein [Emcibacter nanhaiensis]
MTTTKDFDGRELRNVLGRFYTGVTVVTSVARDGTACGVTANSFTSVSLEPPLVLWNQALTSQSHPVYCEADRFVINILAEDQVDVSQRFARPGEDKFNSIATSRGLGGVPVIDGCCAVLECRKVATHEGGDHAIFIGQVEHIISSDRSPLLFGDGKYMKALPLEPNGQR